MSQVVAGDQRMEIVSRRVGKTVCWVIVLILWLVLCFDLLSEVWHLEPWRRAAFCTLAAMGIYWVWRFGLCTYLKASPSALTVRNRFSKWHVPFRDIADVTWIPGQGPQLTLHSGPTVRLDAYAGWPAGRRGRQMMADLTAALRGSPSGAAEISSNQRASGIAELLLVSVWAWFYVLTQMAS